MYRDHQGGTYDQMRPEAGQDNQFGRGVEAASDIVDILIWAPPYGHYLLIRLND